MKLINKLSKFITESKRVFRITKKPSKQEYFTIVKVSGIGLLVIGFAGFLLHISYTLASVYLSAGIVLLLVVYLMFMKK